MTLTEKIRIFLNRPYQLWVTRSRDWYSVIGIALVIATLINLQLPFGYYSLHHHYKILLLSGFGGIFLVCYFFIYGILPLFYKRYFNVDSWTVRKEILISLLLIFSIGTVSWLYDSMVIDYAVVTIKSFFRIQLYTLTSGLGIKTVTFMFLKIRTLQCDLIHLKEYLISTPIIDTVTSDTIHLRIKSVLIPLFSIQYIQSDRNYIWVHTVIEGIISEKRYRCTLKDVENDLLSYPNLVKCHKSYIVNVFHIDHSKDEVMKDTLYLKYSNKTIPFTTNF